MIIIIIILIILLILRILLYFSIKNEVFCDNFEKLNNLNSNILNKFLYFKLNNSNTNKQLLRLSKNKIKPLFASVDYVNNIDYLLCISKYIDYKINNSKQTFRSKNNIIIIENIASICTKAIHSNKPYSIYHYYSFAYKLFKIKQKENKMFKYLLGKFLIIELITIVREINKISLIIQKYKKRKININYRKNIFNSAKIYSIFKYNNNSTRLGYSYINSKNIIISNFLNELYNAKHKIKTITCYLKTMF